MEWLSEEVDEGSTAEAAPMAAATPGTPPRRYSTTAPVHHSIISATSATLGALAAAAIELLALWCWAHAGPIAAHYEPGRADVMRMAVQAGAAAGVIAAQLVLLWFVIGRLYPRRTFDRLISWTFALALAAAAGGTVALAVVGR
jgi:hypothetical protein